MSCRVGFSGMVHGQGESPPWPSLLLALTMSPDRRQKMVGPEQANRIDCMAGLKAAGFLQRPLTGQLFCKPGRSIEQRSPAVNKK